jgi:hypothetical protein
MKWKCTYIPTGQSMTVQSERSIDAINALVRSMGREGESYDVRSFVTERMTTNILKYTSINGETLPVMIDKITDIAPNKLDGCSIYLINGRVLEAQETVAQLLELIEMSF